jgi:hypothetical protein
VTLASVTWFFYVPCDSRYRTSVYSLIRELPSCTLKPRVWRESDGYQGFKSLVVTGHEVQTYDLMLWMRMLYQLNYPAKSCGNPTLKYPLKSLVNTDFPSNAFKSNQSAKICLKQTIICLSFNI